MNDITIRINTLQDILFDTYRIYLWHMSIDARILYCNCPESALFYEIFTFSGCFSTVKDHFQNGNAPIILYDSFHLVWIACISQLDAKSTYYLLGPFFTTKISALTIARLCKKLQISETVQNEFPQKISMIPVITFSQLQDISVMLYSCLTGTAIPKSKITILLPPDDQSLYANPENFLWHGTWLQESELIRFVEEGNMGYISLLSTPPSNSQIGIFSDKTNDKLRQSKNECIIFTTLCTRAAIRGGISPESAYSISDYYIQKVEACTSESAVTAYIREMYEVCIKRVWLIKSNQALSSTVRTAIDYIETHIMQTGILRDMAKELGYAEYYLSNKFQKETGEQIAHYIQRRKIETAMNLLKSSKNTAAAVSEILGFCSPSYFSQIFRKHTGISPSEYQKQHISVQY